MLQKTEKLISEPIRALSWKQPYASLMLHGKIETRTWDAKYQSLVLICASKIAYNERDIRLISGSQTENITKLFSVNLPCLINGHAIAVGRLVDSRPMTIKDEAACFVDYRSGLWCHVYEDVTPIKPFPFKGAQGWKKLDSGIWDKIEFLNTQEKPKSCGHVFPWFGAPYPDACCINGRLWDLDSGENGMLDKGGDDPCPWCNTEEYIQDMRDNEESEETIKGHLRFLSERYGYGDTIKYIPSESGNGEFSAI